MKSFCLLFICLAILIPDGCAQTRLYSTSNAHSHNDYEQPSPFYGAFKQRFGSIEVDLILRNDTLYAAHDVRDVDKERTFGSLYLYPVLKEIKLRNGKIYPKQEQSLQLLIDLKTGAKETLKALITQLHPYKDNFFPQGSVMIVISGNTPAPDEYAGYPDYIYYDGRPGVPYTSLQLSKIGLISQSFQKYSAWDGEGLLSEHDRAILREVVDRAHNQGKKIRFWASPDTPDAWKALQELGVDYINTDRITDLALYLKKQK